MENTGKTIIAVSTAIGKGAIGIVRLSGPDALEMVLKFFKPRKKFSIQKIKSHTIHVGNIFDPNNNKYIDEVMVSFMKGPNSYTGEDVVEISCHNNKIILEKILELGVNHGACLAGPGEFTERAFLNGKMDLAQAEAVSTLIASDSKFAEQTALKQLLGGVSKKVNGFRERLIKIIADIEVALDHEDVMTPKYKSLVTSLAKLRIDIENSINENSRAEKAFQGISIVLSGRPNVGKSSLLNTIVKKEKAIVTDVPGTTRDPIEGVIEYKGIKMSFVDTAGIRHAHEFDLPDEVMTHQEIEQLGIKKAREHIKSAEYIFFIIDLSKELDNNDFKFAEDIKDEENKKVILIGNKCDLKQKIATKNLEKLQQTLKSIDFIKVSAKKGQNIEDMLDICLSNIIEGKVSYPDGIMVNKRHNDLLVNTKDFISNAEKLLIDKNPLEIAILDLNQAHSSLGQILGIEITEAILDKIFSNFCIGK